MHSRSQLHSCHCGVESESVGFRAARNFSACPFNYGCIRGLLIQAAIPIRIAGDWSIR